MPLHKTQSPLPYRIPIPLHLGGTTDCTLTNPSILLEGLSLEVLGWVDTNTDPIGSSLSYKLQHILNFTGDHSDITMSNYSQRRLMTPAFDYTHCNDGSLQSADQRSCRLTSFNLSKLAAPWEFFLLILIELQNS
jgi:hypothetical protein